MSAVYVLKTAGTPPVSLSEMKGYLKMTTTTDDALITMMISAATQWGEKYTGREFRANVWQLMLDFFPCRIELARDPVDTAIPAVITYVVAGSPVTIDDSIYYYKKLTQSSEILLFDDEFWPTDGDDREQGIVVEFSTKAYFCLDMIKEGIMRHVAFWYRNRGDCDCDCNSAGKGSGASMFYDSFRIARV